MLSEMQQRAYNMASKQTEQEKIEKSEQRTHSMELLVAILLLPNCLTFIAAAIAGAIFNSPTAALIVGCIVWVAQVILIVKADKHAQENKKKTQNN